jgi:hypothetical protein
MTMREASVHASTVFVAEHNLCGVKTVGTTHVDRSTRCGYGRMPTTLSTELLPLALLAAMSPLQMEPSFR